MPFPCRFRVYCIRHWCVSFPVEVSRTHPAPNVTDPTDRVFETLGPYSIRYKGAKVSMDAAHASYSLDLLIISLSYSYPI
jgi:hypothetical protein